MASVLGVEYADSDEDVETEEPANLGVNHTGTHIVDGGDPDAETANPNAEAQIVDGGDPDAPEEDDVGRGNPGADVDAYPDTSAQYGVFDGDTVGEGNTGGDGGDDDDTAYPDTDAAYGGADGADDEEDSAYPNTDAAYGSDGGDGGASYPDTNAAYPNKDAQFASGPTMPHTSDAHTAVSYERGDHVWYRDSGGEWHEAIVVHVDHESTVDGEGVSYAVRLAGQKGERSTVGERLRRRRGGAQERREPEAVREDGGEAHSRPSAHSSGSRPSARPKWRPPDWAKPALMHTPVFEMLVGGKVAKSMKIGKRPVTVIGRNGQVSDVVIDDASLSRAHAVVINSSSAAFLQDLDSAHGTYLDPEGRTNNVPQLGNRLSPDDPPSKLEDGYTFRLGSCNKVFRVSGVKPVAVDRWQPPPWVEPPQTKCLLELRLNSFANPYLAHREEDGATVDEELHLNEACLIIGRSTALCDSVIRHESISRQHAAIIHAERASYVQDLNTAGGTFVNRKRIPPNTPLRLSPSDVLSFGESKVTYTFVLATGAAAKKRKR